LIGLVPNCLSIIDLSIGLPAIAYAVFSVTISAMLELGLAMYSAPMVSGLLTT
jgi:hypothetical protein